MRYGHKNINTSNVYGYGPLLMCRAIKIKQMVWGSVMKSRQDYLGLVRNEERYQKTFQFVYCAKINVCRDRYGSPRVCQTAV